MAEVFNGTWKQKEPAHGYEEFCKGLGIPSETIEMFKDKKMILTISISGDTATIDVGVEGLGGKAFTSKFGEEYETVGMDGKPVKIKLNFENGNLVDVARSESSGQDIITTRSLDPTKKVLIQVSKTVDGALSTSTKFEKC